MSAPPPVDAAAATQAATRRRGAGERSPADLVDEQGAVLDPTTAAFAAEGADLDLDSDGLERVRRWKPRRGR